MVASILSTERAPVRRTRKATGGSERGGKPNPPAPACTLYQSAEQALRHPESSGELQIQATRFTRPSQSARLTPSPSRPTSSDPPPSANPRRPNSPGRHQRRDRDCGEQGAQPHPKAVSYLKGPAKRPTRDRREYQRGNPPEVQRLLVRALPSRRLSDSVACGVSSCRNYSASRCVDRQGHVRGRPRFSGQGDVSQDSKPAALCLCKRPAVSENPVKTQMEVPA